MNQYKRLVGFLRSCEDQMPDLDGLMKFHYDHEDLIKRAKGSKKKHQAWEGGYVDHLVECLMIGQTMYEDLQWIREIEFPWHSVVKVIYFHDIEKMWKYSGLTEEEITKDKMAEEAVYGEKMRVYKDYLCDEPYLMDFTDDELNALEHIHGEKTYGEDRIIRPLGAFCHCLDMLSARMWYDKPTQEEK